MEFRPKSHRTSGGRSNIPADLPTRGERKGTGSVQEVLWRLALHSGILLGLSQSFGLEFCNSTSRLDYIGTSSCYLSCSLGEAPTYGEELQKFQNRFDNCVFDVCNGAFDGKSTVDV